MTKAHLLVDRAITVAEQDSYSRTVKGHILILQNRRERALDEFQMAVQFDPCNAVALANRGGLRAELLRGEEDDGWHDLTRAILLAPRDSMIYRQRAQLSWDRKEYGQAILDIYRAIEFEPSAENIRGLAAAYAMCPDDTIRNGKQAVGLALKAMKLAGVDPPTYLLSTLAAAYAANGEFDKAITLQERAMNRDPSDREMVSVSKARLILYRDGLPFTER